MVFTVLVLVLWFLSVMRVTRLVNFDTIMDWLHGLVASKWGPGSWQADFLECPWCVGMWVSLFSAWFPILLTGLSWWLYLPLALAASHIIGITARWSSEPTAMEPDPH